MLIDGTQRKEAEVAVRTGAVAAAAAICVIALGPAACSKGRLAEEGDTVKLHFIGTLKDGSVFARTTDQDPVELTLGDHQIFAKVEEEIVGMRTGDTKTITVPSQEAFGPHREELMIPMNRDSVPQGDELTVGQVIQFERPDGQTVRVKVDKLTESTVVIDANHPLAGKDLTFEIKLIGVL